MTVKELKSALEGVDDNLEVIIDAGVWKRRFVDVGQTATVSSDYVAHVKSAYVLPQSSISNTEFCISAGDTFAY